MKINIDIQDFLEQFNKEYEFLYDHNDRVAGYDEALQAAENFTVKHPGFVREFVRYRGDCLTSDREMVAFMFALDAFIEEE